MKIRLGSLAAMFTLTAGLSHLQAQEMHWGLYGGFTTNNNPSSQTPVGFLPPSPVNPSTNLGAANTFLGGVQAEWKFGPGTDFGRWWGAGLDLAGIAPTGGKVFQNTIGTISPNGYFHVAKWPEKWRMPDPTRMDVYATGGYTALFQQFGANGFNAGAGVNIWSETNGMMIEVRYVREVGSNAPVTGSPYFEVRVGWIHRTGSPR
jgi:hypothetical protein